MTDQQFQLDPTAPGPTPPVATERVRGATTSRNRTAARTRWAIASLVTIVVLLTSAAGFMILSAGAAASALVGYVPAGSVGYLEIRLDAPGDQRQNSANLLSHFPGFADQSTLGRKLDEALDQLVGGASNERQTFTGNIKAWLGDSVALVTTRIPAITSASTAVAAVRRPRSGLLLISVKDPVAARSWADATFGPPTGTETYGGVALTSIEEHGMTVSYGVVANVLLAGDPEAVHQAIDSKGAGAFGDTASFKAAAAAVPGDRLAFGYLDLRQVAQAVDTARSQAASATALTSQLPAWVAVSVRTESDALTATVALPDTNLAPVAANHASVLATKLPATTVAAGELHDLATLLALLTTTIRNSPGASGTQSQVDQALEALGGFDTLVGWMGDSTVAVVQTGNGPTDFAAGVVIQAKDAAAAEAKLLQLKNLVSLAGSSFGVKLTDETYNGTTITVIDLGALAAGTGQRSLPSQVAIAQHGDLVIAGLGDVFVKAVIDTKAGASLADQADYRHTLDQAGSSNTGQLYINLQSALDLVVQHLPADELRHYQADIKPYLDPFRAVAVSGSAGDPNRARFVISVK